MTVAGDSFAAAPSAPPLISVVVGFDDTAREHRSLRFESLPGHHEAELVETAEQSQVWAREARIMARADGSGGASPSVGFTR